MTKFDLKLNSYSYSYGYCTLTMKMITDIHTHLIPLVDDGSKSIEMSKNILLEMKKQGVVNIFLTPHVNSSVSYPNRDTHIKKFNELINGADEIGINLFLGAEIYLPFNFEFNLFKLYNGKRILLVEFSTLFETPIVEHSYNLIKKGFNVIIAHIERYKEYLSIESIIELRYGSLYPT